jgi:hypothetical protein
MTVTRGDSDDLGALATLGRAGCEAPFLALAKVASTNASSRCNLPRSCRCLASKRSASTTCPRESTAESDGGRSYTADTSPASRPIAHHCQESIELHGVRHAYRATDGHDCPHAAPGVGSAPPIPIVRLSVPTACHRNLQRRLEHFQFRRNQSRKCL